MNAFNHMQNKRKELVVKPASVIITGFKKDKPKSMAGMMNEKLQDLKDRNN
jgi:hypothetical protein